MRERFVRFMQGRYGNDRLNQFLMIASVIFLVISFFFGNIFYAVALAFMVYAYFRMFSRNIYKRAAENQAFLKHTVKIREFFRKKKNELNMRKTHHIFRCPNCKQKIKVPKGRGKIEISCRKCSHKFVRKS